MQSELQSYIQQQPPPVQSQQVIQQPSIQQLQQAQFQTMNIGTLGQPNVVTIHQGKRLTFSKLSNNHDEEF